MEFVYVVRRSDLFDLEFPQGFLPQSEASDQDLSTFQNRISEDGYFIEREKAEDDSSLKQVIPYLVVHHDTQIYQVQRLSEQSEERLHSMLSIGLGGHINPEDHVESGSTVKNGVERELSEELILDTPYSIDFAGVVNDDSNPVGSVHFGMVHLVSVEQPEVDIRETENMRGSFENFTSLQEHRAEEPERFESWSRMLIDRVDECLPT